MEVIELIGGVKKSHRSTHNILTFKYILDSDKNGNNNKVFENSPYCWINEVNKLSNAEKLLIGQRRFNNLMKKKYYERCQHSEGRYIQCDICGESRNC